MKKEEDYKLIFILSHHKVGTHSAFSQNISLCFKCLNTDSLSNCILIHCDSILEILTEKKKDFNWIY